MLLCINIDYSESRATKGIFFSTRLIKNFMEKVVFLTAPVLCDGSYFFLPDYLTTGFTAESDMIPHSFSDAI